MDLEQASASIDALIDKRAAARTGAASFEEMAWKESVRKHNARLRRQHRQEWFVYFSTLADSLRRSADHYEAKAEALLENETERSQR